MPSVFAELYRLTVVFSQFFSRAKTTPSPSPRVANDLDWEGVERAKSGIHAGLMANLEQAHRIGESGGDFTPALRAKAKAELALISFDRHLGINHVSISCHRPECQPAISRFMGRPLSLTEEIKSPSLPFEGCQCRLYSEERPFCMCSYQRVFDDEVERGQFHK